jgi:hypothetical protein
VSTSAKTLVEKASRVIVVGEPGPLGARARRGAAFPARYPAYEAAERVAFVDELADAPGLAHHDIVVVHPGSASPTRAIELLASLPAETRPRVVVAGEVADAAFKTLIEHHEVAHVMAWRDEAAELDLLVTLEKLLSNELFGMGRYFDGGGDPQRFTCSSAHERDGLLDWLRTYAAEKRVRSRLIDVLTVAADEMLTNALYNAPTDGQGNHPFAQVSRQVPVSLESPAAVEVELRCDGKRLGISTVDPYGSLRPETVLGSLRRCFRKAEPRPGSTGGAGLGLYLLLGSLSHLIFNVALGKRTEVIGLMDITSNLGRSAAAGKSFNIFVER